MASSQHLKRHASPVAWPVKRKNIAFITRPNAGSYKQKYVTPLVVVLRDVLRYAETSKEVKLALHNSDVLVNGKKTLDIRYPVGMFDTIEIKQNKEKFMLLFDELGKIKLVESKDDNAYLKVTSKTIVSAKKFQINFMNGFNVLIDEKTAKGIKINDTIVYDLIKKKIVSVIGLQKGAFAYIFDGKFKGHFALIEDFESFNGLTRDIAKVKIGNEVHSTAKDYCFAVGTKKEDLKRFS